MNCIIVDDEPLAREAIELLVKEVSYLTLTNTFNNAASAAKFMNENPVDLIFLDIQMPGITGIEFARTIPKKTLIIFTTAYSEYALDSYEVDAIDYLIKPVDPERFKKAAEKALSYHSLLMQDEKENIEPVADEYFFVKSDRKYFKVNFEDILFVEGLKDYVILQLSEQRITAHIEAFDNNDIFIKNYEIGIGNSYRDSFFEEFVTRKRKRN